MVEKLWTKLMWLGAILTNSLWCDNGKSILLIYHMMVLHTARCTFMWGCITVACSASSLTHTQTHTYTHTHIHTHIQSYTLGPISTLQVMRLKVKLIASLKIIKGSVTHRSRTLSCRPLHCGRKRLNQTTLSTIQRGERLLWGPNAWYSEVIV